MILICTILKKKVDYYLKLKGEIFVSEHVSEHESVQLNLIYEAEVDDEFARIRKLMNYKDEIIRSIADKSCEQISRKVILQLQKMTKEMLSGKDANLKNLWDEICVQVQDDLSFYWDEYLDTITRMIIPIITKLNKEIMQCIWLQTEAGIDWEDVDEEEEMINYEDIAEYILREYILSKAGDWTNPRIEKFLEKSYDSD